MTVRLFISTVAFALVIVLGCGQGKIVLSGQGKNINGSPLDNTIFVTVSHGQTTDTVYCDNEGKFSIALTDVPNHSTVVISGQQDDKKVKMFSTGQPCPIDCPQTPYYWGKPNQNIKINTDSAKQYTFNFFLSPIQYELRFATIYFRKNETTMIKSDISADPDSALCFMKNSLKCHGNIAVEVIGYCSPAENSKDALSALRAKFVADKLISMGINPKRLVPVAGGVKSAMHSSDESVPESEQQKVVFLALRLDFKE